MALKSSRWFSPKVLLALALSILSTEMVRILVPSAWALFPLDSILLGMLWGAAIYGLFLGLTMSKNSIETQYD